MAVAADMYRRKIIKQKEEERLGHGDNVDLTEDEKETLKKSRTSRPADKCIPKGYSAVDFYNNLLPLEKGGAWQSEDPEVVEK